MIEVSRAIFTLSQFRGKKFFQLRFRQSIIQIIEFKWRQKSPADVLFKSPMIIIHESDTGWARQIWTLSRSGNNKIGKRQI